MQNVAMSYRPPLTEKAARKGCRWRCGNEDGGTSEWHSVMECIRVQDLPDTKVGRRPILVLRCKRICTNWFNKGKQMTVNTTGAPLKGAENCQTVIMHCLSNTDAYCKIYSKAARCNQNG